MGRKDLIGGGIFTALGVFIWALSFRFPVLDDGHPGPSLFPRVLGSLFIFFGLLIVYEGWKTRGAREEIPPEEDFAPNVFNPVVVILLIASFIAVVHKLGFILSGVAILVILMKKLRVSLLKSSLVSVALACFVFFIFSKVLRVPLPIGLLGW